MRAILKNTFGLFLILQVYTSNFFAYPQEYPKDQIIDTIRCRNVTRLSYSLYLPAQYDKTKSWPAILIFDPSARGRTGVSAFSEAGRKYGFIIACSNNSRNGPMENNFTAAATMLQDINEQFNVNQKQIFAAGFSGGSRFALSFAVNEKRISGVIGCGAGLPGDSHYLPSGKSGFLYYGLAGNRDMNYIEMQGLPEFFSNQTTVISYLRIFSGGHQWPDPGLITEAVEWIILQSMNRKLMPNDQNFISNIENKTQTLINSELNAGNFPDAVMHMRFAARDFEGTPFGSGMIRSLNESEKSAEYQKSVHKWNKMAEAEQDRREKYMNYLMKIVHSGSLPDSASFWWKNETRSLIGIRDKGNPENSQMASRVLNFISILCSEQGTAYYRNELFNEAAIFFEICTMSDSENQNNYFNLARSEAESGKTKEALDALSAAVRHGLVSIKTIESEPAFIGLKNEIKFKELISKLK